MYTGKVVDLSTVVETDAVLSAAEIEDVQARSAADAIAMAPILAKQADIANARAEAMADNIVQNIENHTPAECMTYVDNNTATLAAVRALLKKMVLIQCVQVKQGL